MATVKLYVRDLVRRSRVETAAATTGLDVVEESPDVVVVDLADEGALKRFVDENPSGRAVGFYPHVRRELAEVARSRGIEPYENRVFFDDPAELLRRLATP